MTAKGAVQYPYSHKYLIDVITEKPQSVRQIQAKLIDIVKEKEGMKEKSIKGTHRDTITKYLRQLEAEGKIKSMQFGEDGLTVYFKI